MADKFTDVEYEEVQELQDDIYYTAVQVARILEEDVSTIRSWTSKQNFEEQLGINRINNRRVFTKTDIENLRFVKELRAKNIPLKKIKEYVSQHGFKYADYNAGLVNPADPLGFTALASALAIENRKQLEGFLYQFVKKNEEFKNELININKQNNEEMRQEILQQLEGDGRVLQDNIQRVVGETIENNMKPMQESLDVIQMEYKALQKDIANIDRLHQAMNDRAEKNQQEQNTGFLKRLFSKFKK